MPRIRTLKPEIWNSESLGRLSRNTRLVFIGIITQADDEGFFRASASGLASSVLPFDRDRVSVVERALRELRAGGQIETWRHSRGEFGRIPGWSRHQRVDKPKKSAFPRPEDPGSYSENVATIRDASRTIHVGSRIEEGIEEGIEDPIVTGRSVDLFGEPEIERKRKSSEAQQIFEALEDWRTARCAEEQLPMGASKQPAPAKLNTLMQRVWEATGLKDDPSEPSLTRGAQLEEIFRCYLADDFGRVDDRKGGALRDPPWPLELFLAPGVCGRFAKDLAADRIVPWRPVQMAEAE